MRLTQICSAIAIASLVQACGSSSDSSSTSTDSDGNYTFTLNAVLTNDCGVEAPFTDVELLLQDADWTYQQTYSPDADGVITFTTSEKNINFTLVAKTQSGDSEEGLDIVSYYQASSSTETTYQATYDNLVSNDTCECITQDASLRHRAFANIDEAWTSLPFEGWESVSDTETLFTDVTACRVIDGDWPVASLMVKGTDDDEEKIGSADFISDFTTDGTGEWAVSAVEVADEISLSKKHPDIVISQEFEEGEHFQSAISEDDDTALLFTSHMYINEAYYKGVAENTLSTSSNLYGSWSVTSGHQVISTDYDDALDAEASDDMPSIDTVSFSELDDDGTYDYSGVKNYPMAIIRFTYGYTSVPVTWTMYGPEEGILPNSVALEGYDDIVDSDSYITDTQVTLLKSDNTNNYDDYIEYYQSLESDDFATDLHQYDITITLQ
ncbi:hypothetical protein [Alteromonas sp. C1M14]|uniref:hypothetical protein n=1 Tax=Alteromonas sp. C1M14 TaxID=2841567 RepID=UPI001C08C035|nr:hypothetical protein [Alteromonas sp. C1M14]MBU2979695.1 hypothetical protein [Alteromonas sp. C1M14]